MARISSIEMVERGRDLQAMIGSAPPLAADGNETYYVFKVVGGDEDAHNFTQGRIMPVFGRVLSDGKVTSDEAAELATLLHPELRSDGRPFPEEVRKIIQGVTESVGGDGRLAASDALAIIFAIL